MVDISSEYLPNTNWVNDRYTSIHYSQFIKNSVCPVAIYNQLQAGYRTHNKNIHVSQFIKSVDIPSEYLPNYKMNI